MYSHTNNAIPTDTLQTVLNNRWKTNLLLGHKDHESEANLDFRVIKCSTEGRCIVQFQSYRKVSNIRRTKSQNLNASRLIL